MRRWIACAAPPVREHLPMQCSTRRAAVAFSAGRSTDRVRFSWTQAQRLVHPWTRLSHLERRLTDPIANPSRRQTPLPRYKDSFSVSSSASRDLATSSGWHEHLCSVRRLHLLQQGTANSSAYSMMGDI